MRIMRCIARAASSAAMGSRVRVSLALLGVMLSAPALWAHHGLAAFDTTRTIKLEGIVTDYQWINPHAFIFADIKDANGKVANWRLELGSLGMLTRYGGWGPDTVKRGDKITVQGFWAKDGSHYLSVGRIWLPNGKTLEGKP